MELPRKILWWFAATDHATLQQCSQRDRMLRTALGLVFFLNYGALLLAWIKVALRYFGWAGLLAGLLVPSIFLALDRIVAMRHRHLSGILAIYNIGDGARDKTELRLRIAMALALSLCTTFTFQMDQASALIRAKAQAQQQAANAGLRQELGERIAAAYDARHGAIAEQQATLAERRGRSKLALDEASRMAGAAADKAHAARDEQDAELGGLGQRARGDGDKFKAQRAIAERNESIAAEARLGQQSAQQALAGVDAELQRLRQQGLAAEAEKHRQLAALDAAMAADSRYIPQQTGLFADATIFIGLFFDPQLAAGMFVLSLLTWGVLLALELSALIALALLPASAYDIALIANLRVDAARMVAEAETELARRASQAPPLRVRPLHPNQPNQPFPGAAGQRHPQEA